MTGILPPRLVLRMTIVRGITILNPPPQALVGVPYSHQFNVFGGTAPYTFERRSSLPAGWAFDEATGTVTATSPQVTDTAVLALYVHDSTWDYELEQTFTITVARVPVYIGGHAPTAHAGIPYSYTYSSGGGIGAKVYTLIAGALPAGMTLNSMTGTISGTAGRSQAGDHTYTLDVVDGAGTHAQVTDQLTVDILPVSVTGHAPNAILQADYYYAYAASGAVAPYTYSYTGALPPGLVFSSGGIFSQYPLTQGTFNFTIIAKDAIGTVGTLVDSITVVDPCGDYHLGNPAAISDALIFRINPTLPIAEHLCNEVKP